MGNMCGGPTAAKPVINGLQTYEVIGDILNTDTRALILILELADIIYKFKPVEVLK